MLRAILRDGYDSELNAVSSESHMPHFHGELREFKDLYEGLEFDGDVYGIFLDKHNVITARTFDMCSFNKVESPFQR